MAFSDPEREVAWNRSYMRDRKQRHFRWLADYKSRPCADCGWTFPPECMDFDHLADKFMSVSKMASYSRDRVLAEVAKCDVVCANCHRTRTKNRNSIRTN